MKSWFGRAAKILQAAATGFALGMCASAWAAAPTIFSTGAQILPMQSGRVIFDNGGPQIAVMPFTLGQVTINGNTPVTVANAKVTASSIIVFTLKTVGGTVGTPPQIETITPGTGFTVQGAASDTSTYNYLIMG